MVHHAEINKESLPYSMRQLLKDIGEYLKPYRWRFMIASLLRLTSDLAGLYPAYALASIVSFFSKPNHGTSLKEFWLIILFWGVAVIWRSFARQAAKYIGFQVSERVALDAQAKTIKKLTLLDISWHEKENAGNKLKRLQKGSYSLDRILRMWLSNFIEIGVNFIGMIYILSKIDRTVGEAMICFIISYFTLSYLLLKRADKATQEVDIKEEEVMGLAFQIINNIRSIKVLAMSEKLLQVIERYLSELFLKIKRRLYCFQSQNVILDHVVLIFRLGILAFVALGIVHGHYELGFLILFHGYFNNLTQSVDELANAMQDLVIYKYSIARMQKILGEAIIIEDEKDKVDFPKDWQKIMAKDLSFSYGENKVLKNISFVINKGERVGIVGLSGAGKSTLIKLLLKEVENYEGEILIDDVPLKKIKRNSYLKNIGVVLQDTEVFNFTLADNVTIAGEKEGDKKDLKKALDIAHVSDFSDKLPLGINTFIGEKGIKLSGGEKQRVGIARAIYKKPKILFLDEATSHLDLESEKKIKDSLHKFLQNMTAVVIAHRLTTIKEMDKILVIEKGKITEEGNYEELFAKRGRFFELWETQKL